MSAQAQNLVVYAGLGLMWLVIVSSVSKPKGTIVPGVTHAQSLKRIKQLKRAGCHPMVHLLPDGSRVVTKDKDCRI